MTMNADLGVAQFENVNELRLYPFADGSSLVDREGRTLPRSLVVDVHMSVPSHSMQSGEAFGASASGFPDVRLTSVHMSRSMVSVCFMSKMDGRVDALSVMVEAGRFAPYVPYRMEKLAGSSDIGGVVTFGNVEFPDFPETYFLDGAVLHPCCVAVSRPAALRKFTDRRSGESVSGDVDIRFSGYVNASKSGKDIRLSLEDGADRELASECFDASVDNVCGATPIRTINGVLPDANGNIVLWFH